MAGAGRPSASAGPASSLPIRDVCRHGTHGSDPWFRRFDSSSRSSRNEGTLAALGNALNVSPLDRAPPYEGGAVQVRVLPEALLGSTRPCIY